MDPCVEGLWSSASCSAFFFFCEVPQNKQAECSHLSVGLNARTNSLGEQKCVSGCPVLWIWRIQWKMHCTGFLVESQGLEGTSENHLAQTHVHIYMWLLRTSCSLADHVSLLPPTLLSHSPKLNCFRI